MQVKVGFEHVLKSKSGNLNLSFLYHHSLFSLQLLFDAILIIHLFVIGGSLCSCQAPNLIYQYPATVDEKIREGEMCHVPV